MLENMCKLLPQMEHMAAIPSLIVGSITLGAITQTTPTTYSVAYTSTYPNSIALSLYYASSASPNFQTTPSNWTLNAYLTGGSGSYSLGSVGQLKYLQIICRNTVYGDSNSAVSSQLAALVSGSLLTITPSQATSSTINLAWTYSGYVGTESLQVYYSSDGTSYTAIGSATTVGSSPIQGISIPTTPPAGNYIQIIVTSTTYGNQTITTSTKWTYTTGSITLSSITQASLTTVNIAWTYSGYGGSESLQVYQSSDGTNYSAVGSSTTVSSSPLNAFSGISAGNYVRLSVTSSLYGNASATFANRWIYY